MSRRTKRKHVMMELQKDEFTHPTENQQIVRVLYSKGNNLHEVQTPDGEVFLASMPVKFRNNIWIKHGDFVVVEPIEEGRKVKAEISRILSQEQIKCFIEDGIWPGEFNDSVRDNNYKNLEDEEDEDLFVNVNHRRFCNDSEDDSSDESDSEDEDEDDLSVNVNRRGFCGDSDSDDSTILKNSK